MKPEKPYDWIKDPKRFKVNGHMPSNRCFHCGYKFVGSKYAAFCNICDLAMTPDPDLAMYIVTERPPKGSKDAIADGGKGYWTTRRQYIATRIRIPEDIDSEEEYSKKLDGLKKKMKEDEPINYYPEFKKFETPTN